ncbi:metallophosphoesterase [Aquisalinus flavus]|uniref:Phosphohydrolase n=1 Tax=Aquisalinus flavus TaxID=1526572 RepID=A0A8J2Y5L7_9PROT|nr:metallophosphoesterase [Aquisalinus flavus]MBD0427229.1 metallophosphoesterase [Aquisalinus flavus]UNE47044.1 hypothetical protein FF099_02710 [Aquisalinus flavus]GGC99352.1 phosphohydrolase [Aquisalinus flavus]
MQLLLYYASYLYFLAVPVILWLMIRKDWRMRKVLLGLFLAFLSVLAYARFVEPRILLVKEHELNICTAAAVGEVRAAVFSDTHNGIFDNAMPVRRIVERVNGLDADLVLIPGDFTYHPPAEDLPDLFAPLADLTAPAFATMGNHDVGLSGEDLTRPLIGTLDALGVTVLDGGAVAAEAGGQPVNIIGLPDHWGAQRDGDWVTPEPPAPGAFTFAIEHNPDVLEERRTLPAFDLMVAGHTHGGQINIPLVTCALTFACDTLRYGYSEERRGNLFVTSGTGMVGLPMRFNVPPVIDMLTISYGPC